MEGAQTDLAVAALPKDAVDPVRLPPSGARVWITRLGTGRWGGTFR